MLQKAAVHRRRILSRFIEKGEHSSLSLSLSNLISLHLSLSFARTRIPPSISLSLSLYDETVETSYFIFSVFVLFVYCYFFAIFFFFCLSLYVIVFLFPLFTFFFSSLSFKFIRSRGCDTSLGTSGYGRRLARLTEKTNFDSLAEKLAWPVYEGRHIYSSGPKDQWRKLATRPSASEATHRSSSCNNLCTILQPTTPPTI